MTKQRRLLASVAGLAMVAAVSLSRSQGEPGQKGPAVRPVVPVEERNLEKELAGSKFDRGGVITYQTLKGENLFALQLKPQLPAAPIRKRDYLIVICNSAAQAGEPGIAANQIADAIIETAGPDDRVSLWILSTPEQTRTLTKGFLYAKEDRKKLNKAIVELKNKPWPGGASDLKTGLAKAIATFDGADSRQRILLYLGDGQSTHNPIEDADRQALIQDMVKARIAFFPVPLGLPFNSENLHGLATGTGGTVLRTWVNEEKLPVALKRYQEAFAGPILYDAQVKMPATVIQVVPKNLPPLRADAPTLLVGRIQAVPAIAYTLTGTIAGQPGQVSLEITEKVPAAELDNYFLVRVVDQWAKAKTQPALMRANRLLAFAYENTRQFHGELLLSAQIALEKNEVLAALHLYEEAKALDPHDAEAEAGIKICANLKDGKLTREIIKAQMEKAGRNVDKVERVNGVVQWRKADLALLAQPDKNDANDLKKEAQAVQDRDDLLQAHRDRIIVEEQKMTQTVETALRQARKELASDPDGTLDFLRNTLTRVKDHPDLSDRTRDALGARLETALREVANRGRAIKLGKDEKIKIVEVARKMQEQERERKTIEDRIEAQFRVYKNLMNLARFEEHTKTEVLQGLENMAIERRRQGGREPLVAAAAYNQVSAAFNLQRAREIRQLKEQRFMEVMLSVDKSHIPFSDEPGIYFPPLKTWQAITKLRKEKYEVSSLPDDDKGRKEAKSIADLLAEPLPMGDFQNPMTLKEALGLFYEKFAAKQKELPIMIDTAAFKEENPDAAEVYDTPVKFPPYPKVMSMATALRIALSQVPTNNATYLIRRNYIEVTTNDRMVREKVLRVYPVGDLVIPISQAGGTQNFNFQGGGQQGQQGQIGQFGQQLGQIGQIGQQLGQFGQIGQLGQIGGQIGQIGQIGLGGGLGGIGQIGQLGQIGLGGIGQIGQLGQIGLGGVAIGGFGQPQGQLGNFQGVGGSFNGGSFQGGFNGSLGALGATQAVSLISVITKVVAPGEWFITKQPNPFQQNIFQPFGGAFGMMGMGGMFGMGAMFGGGGNNFGMMGAGPPPTPVSEGGPADIQQANTIEFFPPALAIIVRAPSRVHTSITGGIIGGKQKRIEGAMLEAQQKGLAFVGAKGKIEVAGAAGGGDDKPKKDAPKIVKIDPKKNPELDPTTVWNEELGKGGVDAGMVVATADFLFEAGHFQHAAEFLKANLRRGIVVRPWVYEALAVALEASGGDPDEIRRARLSAVSLDPGDAQGFLQAARTMADHKQYDRALAFCRQAALLEPNLSQPYAEALAYAELGKDSKSMEWAVGKLLSQDWASDNQLLHLKAQTRVQTLSQTLRQDNRVPEADKLKQALQTLRERDLIIKLSWDIGSEPADLELEVKEPTGTVCSTRQKQTPGGGILLGTSLMEMTETSYMAAQAFSGAYEIRVRRLFGQPLAGRAHLDIIQHLGTPQETRRRETIRLDQTAYVKFQLKNGRRTELASVPPAIQKRTEAKEELTSETGSVLLKLRSMSFPTFSGASAPRGGAGTPGRLAKQDTQLTASQVGAVTGAGGVNLNAQVKVSADQRETNLVLQPVFQTVIGNRPTMNLPLIPGSGPAR